MDAKRELRLNIFSLFKKGKVREAQKMFEENGMDYLEVSNADKWNWLHQLLMGFDPAYPPRETIEFFIKKGVPVNAQDIYGMTPLHYAMRAKNGDAAIALLEAGADPNIPNQDNLRPLSMIGYMPNRLDILEMMLDKGANVDNIINENETILESYNPKKYPFLDGKIYNIMKPYSKV
ncbi:ankyrin repeat domain-containing protein [Avibacterium paragallinarum]|uniref:ankyrin repeat domain-containing protein n=1 Tax=Avibacterium paragallinarum TaxID=728 RepID=UPI002ED90CDD